MLVPLDDKEVDIKAGAPSKKRFYNLFYKQGSLRPVGTKRPADLESTAAGVRTLLTTPSDCGGYVQAGVAFVLMLSSRLNSILLCGRCPLV